jgi:endonuclease/exonuclease/phosphatase family metal-dependent hydrolase
MKNIYKILSLLIVYSSYAVADTPSTSIKVMSYNVRAILSADECGNGDSDPDCPTIWTNRKTSLLNLIEGHSPDIFGVQEASSSIIRNDLYNRFSNDYYYYQPTGGSPKIIFYKKSEFYNSTISKHIALPNNYQQTDSCHSNASGRTGSLIKIESRSTQKKFIVVNAHFAHGSCSMARQDSAAKIRQEINDNISSGDNIIVLGDINIDYQSSDYNENTIDILLNGLSQDSTTGTFSLYNSQPKFDSTTESNASYDSTWGASSSTKSKKIDYIFHSKDLASGYQTDQFVNADGVSPSDHFPIIATLRDAVFSLTKTTHSKGLSQNAEAKFYYADVTGDGCADKILWRYNWNGGKSKIYKSNCDGTFQDGETHEKGKSEVADTQLFFSDVTGDGCADKIFWRYNHNGGNSKVYPAINCKQSGAGHFGSAISNTKGGSENLEAKFYYVDVTGDKCADKILWRHNWNGGKSKIYKSNCNGTFQDGETHEKGKSENSNTQFFYADVTGDGCADKIFWRSSYNGGDSKVYPAINCNQAGAGHFGSAITNTVGTSQNSESKYYYTDVTGDGCADKIFWRYNWNEGYSRTYESNCDGTFKSFFWNRSGRSQNSSTQYFFEDITGDKKADKIFWRHSYDGGKSRSYNSLENQGN